MKVFIGSSQESYEELRDIASWVEDLGLEPLPWDEPTLFLPGESTFQKLVEITKRVEGAIFIFGEDDRVWYRTDGLSQPRDNVLVEYGMFAGALGPARAIICRKGSPKLPTDLLGITYININEERKNQARVRLLAWARNLGKPLEDPVVNDLIWQREVLRKERDEIQDRLVFEEQKSSELQALLADTGQIDFVDYAFEQDGYWKLLFDYDFFSAAVEGLAEEYRYPRQWRAVIDALPESAFPETLRDEQWDNPDRTRNYIAKSVRGLRTFKRKEEFLALLKNVPESVQRRLRTLAERRAHDAAQRIGRRA